MTNLKDIAKVIVFLIGGFAIIVVGGFMMRSIAKLWENNDGKKKMDRDSNNNTMMMLSVLVVLIFSTSVNYAHAAIGEYSVNLSGGAWEVQVNKQVQITADLTNNQDRTQPFAYLVQIQNAQGVTISLSWITGTLEPGQSMNPSQSWTTAEPGMYDVQIFVWKSVDNPDALSAPLMMKLNVVETTNI